MYSVVLLCAGKGKRTGLDYNKMLYKFKDKTVYEMTLNIFLSDEKCREIVVVTSEEEQLLFKQLCDDQRIIYTVGGKERQDSVYNGLKLVTSKYVLIHDGARPYVKLEHINCLLECLKEHKACLLMVPCKDTIKKVVGGKIVETLVRSELMQAQTPQAFHKDVVFDAYTKAIESHYMATDDAQMVEVFSDEDVYVVLGDYDNKKITTPEDLV